MGNDILMIAKAVDFSARKHVHQRRKGEMAEPYVNHVTDVARILAEATEGKNTTLIVAGLLHDTIEDQNVTHDELLNLFGKDVADLVLEVTDDMSIAKPERKLLQVANAPYKSAHAKMLRMADKISNLNSILTSAPKHWDYARRREYFEWAKRVVDGCRGVNARLEELLDATYQKRLLVPDAANSEYPGIFLIAQAS